jgi:hypothetical protein
MADFEPSTFIKIVKLQFTYFGFYTDEYSTQ